VIESLALASEAARSWHSAYEWWPRLFEVDPVTVRVESGLVPSQAAGGDPAGALQRAEVSAMAIREEAGVRSGAGAGARPGANLLAPRFRGGRATASAPR